MPDADVLESWVSVVVGVLTIIAVVGGAAIRYLVIPVRRSHAMLHDLSNQFNYHLEPNGTETQQQHRERRPMRAIALSGERRAVAVEEALERHERSHARRWGFAAWLFGRR